MFIFSLNQTGRTLFASRLRYYRNVAVAINVILLAFVTAIAMGAFIYFSDQMATQTFRTIENTLALGRYKDSMISLEASNNEFFEIIAFFDGSNQLVFSVSPAFNLLLSDEIAKNTPVYYSKFSYPIYLDRTLRSQTLGTLIFYRNYLKPLGTSVLLWATFSLLYWPFVFWYRQKILLRWMKDRETEDMVAIGLTAQMLAHDVRKPFTLLRMGLKHLDPSTDPEDFKEIVEVLKHETEKSLVNVETMLRDIMDIGSANRLDRTLVDMNQFIKSCIADTIKHYPQVECAVDWRFDDLKPISIDEGKMTRVISNITGNAFEAMNGHGTLTISTQSVIEKSTEKFIITIHNTGSYIPPGDQENLFKPFFTKGKVHGTGLGLVIAQRFVGAHNGEIKVESTPNGGTSFHIKVPVHGP